MGENDSFRLIRKQDAAATLLVIFVFAVLFL